MASDVTKELNTESHIGCKYYFNGRPDVEQVYEMLEDHVNDNTNPHKIVKNQIAGLENVDNTSDADKPISKAQKEYVDILKDEVGKLDDRVKSLQSSVITNRANIKTINEKTFPNLEAEINEKFQAVIEDLSEAITDVEKKETEDVETLNNTIDSLKQTVEEIETLIQLEQSLRANGDAQLKKSIDAMAQDVQTRISEALIEMTENVSAVDERVARVESKFEILVNMVETATQHFNDQISQIDGKIAEIDQRIADAQEVIDDKIDQAKQTLDEETQRVIQELEGMVSEFSDKLNADLEKFKTQISEELDNYEEKIDGRISNINERIDNTRTDLEKIIDVKISALSEIITHMDTDQEQFEARVENDIKPLKDAIDKANQDIAQEVLDRKSAINDLKIDLVNSLNGSKVAQLNISRNLQTSDYTFTITTVDGTVLAQDSINIPVDSVVQSGTYDPTTKSVILTLNNGNSISIPVGGLVSGLASSEDLNKEITDRKEADASVKAELLQAIADSAANTADEFKAVDTRLDQVELASQVLDTKVNEVKNDVDKYYTKKSDLKQVALTGDYNDLSNTPKIPTVDVNKAYVEAQNNILNTKISDEIKNRELADEEVKRNLQSAVDTAVETREEKFSGVLLNLKNTLQAGNIGYIKVIDGGSGASSSIVKTIDLADKLSHVFNYDNNETLVIDLDALKNL